MDIMHAVCIFLNVLKWMYVFKVEDHMRIHARTANENRTLWNAYAEFIVQKSDMCERPSIFSNKNVACIKESLGSKRGATTQPSSRVPICTRRHNLSYITFFFYHRTWISESLGGSCVHRIHSTQPSCCVCDEFDQNIMSTWIVAQCAQQLMLV